MIGTHPYFEPWEDRSQLRAAVWEISNGRCEHPLKRWAHGPGTRIEQCGAAAAELAHIQPRGMGHRGDRDTIANTIAACAPHARSTDDLSSPLWQPVIEWASDHPDGESPRQSLARYVRVLRRNQGWDVGSTDYYLEESQ